VDKIWGLTSAFQLADVCLILCVKTGLPLTGQEPAKEKPKFTDYLELLRQQK
jgi:hypothetical protein